MKNPVLGGDSEFDGPPHKGLCLMWVDRQGNLQVPSQRAVIATHVLSGMLSNHLTETMLSGDAAVAERALEYADTLIDLLNRKDS